MPNIKFIVCGDAATGKTEVCEYLNTGSVREHPPYATTKGVEFCKIVLDEANEIHLWELSGAPQFESVAAQYRPVANVAYLFVDISRQDSLVWAQAWLTTRVDMGISSQVPIFLVANKQDIAATRQVTEAQLEALCSTHNLAGSYQVSALTGAGLAGLRQGIIDFSQQQLQPVTPMGEVEPESLLKNEACRLHLQMMLTELQAVLIPYKQGLLATAKGGGKTGIFYSKSVPDISAEIDGLQALEQALIAIGQGQINHETYAADVVAAVDGVRNGEAHQKAFEKHGGSEKTNRLRKKAKAQDFCDRLVAGATRCTRQAQCCLQ